MERTISLHVHLPNVQVEGPEGEDIPFAAQDGRGALGSLGRGGHAGRARSLAQRAAGQRVGEAAHDAEAHQRLLPDARHSRLGVRVAALGGSQHNRLRGVQHLIVQLHALDAAVQLGFGARALCLHLEQVQRQIEQLILQAPAQACSPQVRHVPFLPLCSAARAVGVLAQDEAPCLVTLAWRQHGYEKACKHTTGAQVEGLTRRR